jgi:hypothetical protein
MDLGNEELPKMRERARGLLGQKGKGPEIKDLTYPIVDTLCDLGFRCRFFAVSCWTKLLGGGTCEVLVAEDMRPGLTCTGSPWTDNAGERIEGSPNCDRRYFGRVAYLALEWVVEHKADEESGSKNQPPTLSFPGIRLHLTLRALEVGRL